MMIAQIYEIQTPWEAERCMALGVDHIGSVLLSEEEWRQPLIKDIISLSAGTQVRNSLLPLFRTRSILYRVLDYYRPHFIHFCDSLTDLGGNQLSLEEFISLQAELRENFPEVRVIRSIPVPPSRVAPNFPTLSIAHALEPVTDFFLVDTWVGDEPVEGFIGITGKTADWDRARRLVMESRIPVILAGGLSPENVGEALLKVTPYGADSCTHTNSLDPEGRPIRFTKDFKKVEMFVHQIHEV